MNFDSFCFVFTVFILNNCLATTVFPSPSLSASFEFSETLSIADDFPTVTNTLATNIPSESTISTSISSTITASNKATVSVTASNIATISVTASNTATVSANERSTSTSIAANNPNATVAASESKSTSSVTVSSSALTTIPTTKKTTTKKPITPTTLSPLLLKQIWCKYNYGSWKMPEVGKCVDTFRSQCSDDITNATNAFLLCKSLLGKNPSSQYKYKMKMVGDMDDLGMQLARNFYAWHKSTSNDDKYRFKRIIKDKMIFDAGITYKWADRTWPEYNKAGLFKKSKWNGRNDTIRLPYATMTAGTFKYSFNLYDNIFDADVTKEEVRLKNTWRSGHLISVGVYIDYMAEKDLFYSSKYKINSAVISLSIDPKPIPPVASDIIITFWHKKPGMFKPLCVYWQFVKTDDASTKYIGGYWTNYGMRVVKTNTTTTICASSHLSAFAVLMEPVYEKAPEPIDNFTLATIILTVVSIISLIIYLVAMAMLGCLRTQYSRMYMYISSACLLSQVVFVLALLKKDNWSMCTTMSIIMQFCHTTVMSWIMIESVHQLSRIRYFFNEVNSNIEAFYSCIGWGFPFAVVVALIGYPFEQFSDVKYCWVYVKGLPMWFFCGPLVALLLISVILRLITYYEIRKHPERLKRDINYQRAWRSLVASIFFLPLIATLWLVATWGVTKSKTEAGPYLITLPILNLVVGLMVFIFYFYKNDEVHDALVEQRKIKEKKRLLRYEHLKGMKMKVSYKD